MSRLTKRLQEGKALCIAECEKECVEGYYECHKCKPFADVLKKLAEYEDAEENGLLLRLPCKVGDTVYKLWYKPCHNGEDYPDSYSCCGCEDECDLKRDIFDFTIPSIEWILQHIGRFGDGVWYLKREEAEQALKQMGE